MERRLMGQYHTEWHIYPLKVKTTDNYKEGTFHFTNFDLDEGDKMDRPFFFKMHFSARLFILSLAFAL